MVQMRGQLVILLILLLAFGLGGFAWWHHYRRGRQSLQLWGPPAAVLIRYAPDVEYLELGPPGESPAGQPLLQLGEQSRPVTHRSEIMQAPGLVHARHALVEDASFRWEAEPIENCHPEWKFALRFLDGNRQATVAFDLNCGRLMLVESQQFAVLREGLPHAFARWVQGEQP